METEQTILAEFKRQLVANPDAKMLEIIGANFIVDKGYIIKEPNEDYIDREIQWYLSQSLNVNDIPGGTPKIWRDVATRDGFINSNYGWAIFSNDNYNQFNAVVNKFLSDPDTRQGIMIYNRPEMQRDWDVDGMHDFMCALANQFYIRDNKLYSIVTFRSNDAVFGYNNDAAWFKFVYNKLLNTLRNYYPALEAGNIQWFANSLHVYPRHFKYLTD